MRRRYQRNRVSGVRSQPARRRRDRAAAIAPSRARSSSASADRWFCRPLTPGLSTKLLADGGALAATDFILTSYANGVLRSGISLIAAANGSYRTPGLPDGDYLLIYPGDLNEPYVGGSTFSLGTISGGQNAVGLSPTTGRLLAPSATPLNPHVTANANSTSSSSTTSITTTCTGPTVRSTSDHPSPPTHQPSEIDTSKS